MSSTDVTSTVILVSIDQTAIRDFCNGVQIKMYRLRDINGKSLRLKKYFRCCGGRTMNLSSLFRQTTSVFKELQVAFASPLVYVFWFVASLLVGLFFYLGL